MSADSSSLSLLHQPHTRVQQRIAHQQPNSPLERSHQRGGQPTINVCQCDEQAAGDAEHLRAENHTGDERRHQRPQHVRHYDHNRQSEDKDSRASDVHMRLALHSSLEAAWRSELGKEERHDSEARVGSTGWLTLWLQLRAAAMALQQKDRFRHRVSERIARIGTEQPQSAARSLLPSFATAICHTLTLQLTVECRQPLP